MRRKSAKNRYRIEFRYGGHRFGFSLGACGASWAHEFKAQLERLLVAKGLNRAPSPDTAEWLERLPNREFAKLSACGLVDVSHRALTLGAHIAQMLKDHPISTGGEAARKQAHESLKLHFGADRQIRTITEADAKAWWGTIIAPAEGTRALAIATRYKRLKDCKAVFNAAVRYGKIVKSPFTNIRASGSQVNPRRQHYITHESLDKFLTSEAISLELKSLLALARFAGLRCPSEAINLRWADIDFAENKMFVPNAKLGCGGCKDPWRVVPMRGRLKTVLGELFAATPAGEELVFGGVRARIAKSPWHWLKRAFKLLEVTPWEKPWQNLRASYVTELRQNGLSAVQIAKWSGHSVKVANQHYVLEIESDFQAAINLDGTCGLFVGGRRAA
jgi:integrase